MDKIKSIGKWAFKNGQLDEKFRILKIIDEWLKKTLCPILWESEIKELKEKINKSC